MSPRTVLGAFNSEVVTLTGGTAAILNGVSANRPTPRLSLTITPTGSIFLGGKNVSAANGMPLAAGASLSLDCMDGLYAFSASGTTVSILEGF